MVCRAKRRVQVRISGRNVLRRGAVVAAVLAIALAGVRGWAAKPGGPPPAIGRIYFNYGSQPYSMDGSGGNKTVLTADSAPGSRPSRLRYSYGSRWSLFMAQTGTYDRVVDADGNLLNTDLPHFDLFASRPDGGGGTEVLQITDLYGAARVSHVAGGEGFIVWSNDGQDSFVSFRGSDFTDAFRVAADGKTEIDWSNARDSIIALGVSGADLDAAANSGTWAPIGPADDWAAVVSSPGGGGYANNYKHTWSPDGTMVAYVIKPDSNSGEYVYVTDLATGTTQLVFGASTSINPWVYYVHWQPEGDVISLCQGGNLWVADAGGGGAQVVISGNTDTAFWSPDGNHFVIRSVVRKGFNLQYQLQRYDIATGNLYTLTADLDKSVQKDRIHWLID